MSDLGPPLTEAEHVAGLRRRMSRPGMGYGPEVVARIRELIELGATYPQILERVPVETLDRLRTLCSKHRMHTKKPMRGGNHYSSYSRALVRRLIADGAGYVELVKHAGLPNVDAARSFVARHNMGPVKLRRRKSISEDEIEGVRLLAINGFTIDQIVPLVGRNRNIVSGIIWRYGLRSLKQRPESFKCIYGKVKEDRRSVVSSPDRPAQLAAGLREAPPTLRPVCSYRGVTLAHV